MYDYDRKCKDCKNYKTLDCPTSHLCYSTKSKPYFESKYNRKTL